MSCVSCTSAWITSAIFHSDRLKQLPSREAMSASQVSIQRQSSETCSPRVCPPDATGVRYGVSVGALRMLLWVYSVERGGTDMVPRCEWDLRLWTVAVQYGLPRLHSGDLVSPRVPWRGRPAIRGFSRLGAFTIRLSTTTVGSGPEWCITTARRHPASGRTAASCSSMPRTGAHG